MTTSTHFIPSESALELLCGAAQPHRGSALMRGLKRAGRVAAGSAVLAGGMVSALYSVLETNPIIFLAKELSSFAAIIAGYTVIGNTPLQEAPEKEFYYGTHLDENGCGGAPGFTRVPPTRRERDARCLERVYPVTTGQIRDEPKPFFGKLVFVNGAELTYTPADITKLSESKTTIATSVRARLLPGYFSFETHLSNYEHATSIANASPHSIANSSYVAFPTPVWMMGRLSEGFGRHGPLDSSFMSEPQLTLYNYGAAFEQEKTLRDHNYVIALIC